MLYPIFVKLYIFWFLHQTTTRYAELKSARELYIFWFLHQTTTGYNCCVVQHSCISFDSYIKPQLFKAQVVVQRVVYLLIPTSNHNHLVGAVWYLVLYIFWFLHQTTTGVENAEAWRQLYIFWFLHQTTTTIPSALTPSSCISFDSYIKPQRGMALMLSICVVYLLIPTSNHNSVSYWLLLSMLYIFWFLHQTTTKQP